MLRGERAGLEESKTRGRLAHVPHPPYCVHCGSDMSLFLQELRSQKQKIVSERERLQAELDHLRKCLALPAMHWPRGYYKGYPR